MASGDWRPTASLDALRQRARLIQTVRQYFIERDYLEVDTPCLGQFGITDVYLDSIKATCNKRPHYLQTSPEYAMKRLLASGCGPIFQIGKAFRDEEHGRWHQPEFTLLEFYQLDIDHMALIEIVDDLMQQVLNWPKVEIISYQDVFEKHCGFNPHEIDIDSLKTCVRHHHLGNILAESETDVSQYLFLLMTKVIEPQLARRSAPVALIDFPASQSALAQIKDNKAQRFELYYQGIELANGFHELSDATEQLRRFEGDNEQRHQQGKASAEIDTQFIAAIEHGLPACSGVAVGMDRLIALSLGHTAIKPVISFAQ